MAERVLKKGMSINCRTEEEREVFLEFAHKEGHRWTGGDTVFEYKGTPAPCSIQIEYDGRVFPKSMSHAEVGWKGLRKDKIIQVEASELFRNQLISRRIKDGRT